MKKFEGRGVEWFIIVKSSFCWALACVFWAVQFSLGGREASAQDIEVRYALKTLRPNHMLTLAFSPNGEFLANTDGKGGVQLWNLHSGKSKLTLSMDDLSQRACCLAFSPNGDTLALGFVGKIGFWDITTRTERNRIATDEHFVPSFVIFAPDGKTLAALRQSRNAGLWELPTGQLRATIPLSISVKSMTFSPNAKTLTWVAGSSLYLWSEKNRFEAVLPLVTSNLECVAFAPSGDILAAGGFSETVLLEVASRKGIAKLDGRDDRITHVAFSPDGRTLATANGRAQNIHLWEIHTRKVRGILDKQNALALAFSPDGRCLAVGCRDGTINLWDLAKVKSKPPGTMDVDRLWSAMGNEDAQLAYDAIRTLSAFPGQSLPLLREQLRPLLITTDELKKINRLLAAMNSDDFATREKASNDLAHIGSRAGAGLSRALADKPSLEFRKRASEALERIERQSKGDSLQVLRAVEVLEHIGTAEARALLRTLAEDAAEVYLWREAQATLARLGKRPTPKP